MLWYEYVEYVHIPADEHLADMSLGPGQHELGNGRAIRADFTGGPPQRIEGPGRPANAGSSLVTMVVVGTLVAFAGNERTQHVDDLPLTGCGHVQPAAHVAEPLIDPGKTMVHVLAHWIAVAVHAQEHAAAAIGDMRTVSDS